MYFGEKSCEIFTFNKVRKIHKNLALIISKLLLLLLLFLFLVFWVMRTTLTICFVVLNPGVRFEERVFLRGGKWGREVRVGGGRVGCTKPCSLYYIYLQKSARSLYVTSVLNVKKGSFLA